MVKTLAALVAASFATGCVAAHPPQPVSQARSKEPEERHVYRVDFQVASNDPGKPAQTSAYTLNLTEWGGGEVRMGSNVALPTAARVDVGLRISLRLSPMTHDELMLSDTVEMTALDEPSAPDKPIHKVVMNGDAVLRPGARALVASLEDPTSHRHYELTAAATMIR